MIEFYYTLIVGTELFINYSQDRVKQFVVAVVLEVPIFGRVFGFW